MKYYEDDSKGIPDYIKNMSKEEMDSIITKFESEAKRKRTESARERPLSA